MCAFELYKKVSNDQPCVAALTPADMLQECARKCLLTGANIRP